MDSEPDVSTEHQWHYLMLEEMVNMGTGSASCHATITIISAFNILFPFSF